MKFAKKILFYIFIKKKKVIFFLARGANIWEQNNSEKTCKDLASEKSNLEFVRLIEEYEEEGTVWNSSRNSLFPKAERERLQTFLLINRFRVSERLRVPRFLSLHILKLITTQSLVLRKDKLRRASLDFNNFGNDNNGDGEEEEADLDKLDRLLALLNN